MTTEELNQELTILRQQLPNVLAYQKRKALVNQIVELEKAIRKAKQERDETLNLFD